MKPPNQACRSTVPKPSFADYDGPSAELPKGKRSRKIRRMRTLIFEGISTSGKSTIIQQLEGTLKPNRNVRVVPENDTLMRIVDNTDRAVSIAYLTRLINEVYAHNFDFVLFDRLYLTHAFRTHSSLADYAFIEDELRQFTPATIFLEVDENAIATRVQTAAGHRDPEWKDYIYTKGETIDEIADYYIQQQRNQLMMLRQSMLPYKIFNTTRHEYESLAREIAATID